MQLQLIKDIPEISFFNSGNIYIGSITKSPKVSETTFNYKITPKDNMLNIEVWYGMYCIGLSDIEITKQFPLDENGLQEMVDWINKESAK